MSTTDFNLIHQIDDLKQYATKILAEIKRKNVNNAEIFLSVSKGLSTSVRQAKVETIQYHYNKHLNITVYFGCQKGTASTNDLSDVAITKTIQAACDIAQYTIADEYNGLADAQLMATEFPDLYLHHPHPLSQEKLIEQAFICEEHAVAVNPQLLQPNGVKSNAGEGLTIYANSHGFIGHRIASSYNLGCNIIARQNDEMQRDHWYTVAHDFNDLESASAVGQQAAQRALQRLSPKTVPTNIYPVIFSAQVATSLLGHFIQAISGHQLYRKTSFLGHSLEKQVFSSQIQIDENPYLTKGWGSAAFDNEGVNPQQREIVSNGVIKGYVLNSYSARKLGMQTTGNAGGVHNLTLAGTVEDLPTLLHQMDTGILATELMGMGINLITGDYSRGMAGFWVEQGEIQYPIQEVTIASNLADMFQNIQAVGKDLETRSNIRTGSILIEKMTVAGK